MKLAYVDLSRPIELDYQKATEWVIESPEHVCPIYANVVSADGRCMKENLFLSER